MAQTQLNRVYVQSIDGTGVTVNTLSIGTKALTSGITIGGAGTALNTITVDSGGVRINSSTTLEGSTTIPNLNATTAIVSGNTSLQNTSTLHLGVRGNASIVNASINALTVVGQTTLANTSITNLGVTTQITLQNTSINGTLNVAGLTTMVNVSTTSLSVINNVSIGGNVSIIGHLRSLKLDTGNASVNGTLTVAGQTVLQNTSVNTTLNVDGRTTLRLLDVNALAVLNAGLNVTGATTVEGNFTSSSLTINSGTVLNNVSLTTLTVSGNSSLNGVDIRGAVNINTGGTFLTTIGNSTSRTVIANVSTSDVTVTGRLVTTGNTSLQNVSAQALTVGPLWAGATTATTLTTTGLATMSSGLTSTAGNTTLGATTATTLTATGLATMSGGLTSTAGNTTLGATTATTLTATGLATMSGGLTSSAGNTTLGVTTATTLTATGLATLSGGVTATGAIAINGTGAGLTTIGTSSRTVIGNMSTSNTTVTGSLWVTGATEINKSGAGITEIGNSGSRTVIGNTSIIGGVDINSTSLTMTTIGNTQAGSRTIIGNTSMNGSIDINTIGTGITTMGSATSSTVVKGDMSVTKLLTTGYTPALYNYAPTFFAAGFSGGNVSTSDGPEYGFTLSAATANVSSISPVSFMANKKYIINFNARTTVLGPKVTILGSPMFDLTTTNTLYRQVVTATANTTTLSLAISNGASGNKIIWSLLTIEPFYDMTLGSNQISLGGEINVSAGNPYTDWDPTRMLFTTSTITVGANPRIAIGKNSVTNISTYVATSDGTVDSSFFSSTDGVTWGQGNFTAVTNPRGIAYNELNSTFYMITGESPAKVWTSTAGSSGWSVFATTSAINSVTNMIYGNGNLVAFNSGTSGNIMNIGTGTTWSVNTNQVPKTITDMAYGKIGSAHLFVACATNSFYRNTNGTPNGYIPGDWGPATTSQTGTWAFVGFGNNTFIAASNDATGKVSRSVDGGLVWQTPILLNEILTSEPIYLEDTWFIGSNTGLYVSKDNGLTWTKRVGNSLTRSVYGGKFVDVGTSLSLITKRNQRTDGSSISPDVITIGQEGATTVIGGTTTLSGGLSVTSGPTTLSGGLSVTSGPTTLSGGLSVTSGATTLSGGLTSTAGTTTLGTTSATLLGLYSSNNNILTIGRRSPSRYDSNILGFGCGGSGAITEPSADATGNDATIHAARIKSVSNINHPFDYGANATLYFQFKSGNNWGRGITGEGTYFTAMTINGYGNVGVGITTPTALLDVNGALVYVSAAGRSDRRIKTNILDVEDQQALIDLRRLKPKTYTYKDTEKRGHERVYGFIAQEVKEVLNYAGVLTKQSIPNIYEHVDFVNDILTFTTFNTSSLERDASGDIFPRIQVKSICQIDEYLTIIEVLDEHTLKVDTSSWSKDASGQLIGSENPFVYGQEVNDFHTLNKDAIWTVATAALQEVDRQLQAEKQKTALMQTALNALLERVNALEQKTSV